MKVLSVNNVRSADQFTIENEPIRSIDLMERASRAFVGKFIELFSQKQSVKIFCGTGNNGGDGLAIARMLREKNWLADIFVCGNSEKGSDDFKENFERVSEVILLNSESDFPPVKSGEIVVDALFGSGLSRPVEGVQSELIQHLNQQDCTRVSVDIASGLYADQPKDVDSIIFKPHHTISFQLPKLIFFLPDAYEYVGDWHIVDIGLDQSYISNQPASYYLTEQSDVRNLFPTHSRFSHKSQVGRLLLVAGSKGKMGAAALCARAALRSGIGLINVCVPQCGTEIIQILVPEAMVIENKGVEHISQIPGDNSVFGIGPGIGTDEATCSALADFLKVYNRPLVLDADALNILALNPDLLEELPNESILTPHPGEFKRLVGEWKNDFEKLEKLSHFCKKFNINIVLKGAWSAVCDTNGIIHFNSTGNPGMATAGSGDVLTGIVSSFLAQGLLPFDALRLGVFVHGRAGDLAAEELGEKSLIASDLITFLPKALKNS
ncbi:MAG: NAD(P)H-hydrate dehydratase [Cyclobacteriaceae bacterium]